jgi:hypothetical protein
MKHYQTSQAIQAPREKIWAILTDAPHYTDWDQDLVSLNGRIALGEKIAIKTKYSSQTFRVTVKEFTPPSKMVWASGLPLGLFSGSRTFTLADQGGGQTLVTVAEVFSGPLLALFGASIPDMNPIFAKFLQALKAQAEK